METTNKTEILSPEYRDAGSVKLPTVYRHSGYGERYYFQHIGDDVVFLPSCTTIIKKTLPTSPGILKKHQELGDRYYDWLMQKADYGTFLHLQFAEYLRNMEYNFDALNVNREVFQDERGLMYNTQNWTDSAKRDLLCLVNFVQMYNVKPLYVEQPITYYSGSMEQPRFGSVVDLICEMDYEEKGFFGEVYKTGENKGMPKETKRVRRVVAAIDLKSGKNGFWDDHAIQLKMYQIALQQSGVEVEKLFNIAPTDWRETPTFKIKDQTNEVSSREIHLIMQLYFARYYREPSSQLEITGRVNGSGLEGVYSFITAKEIAKRRFMQGREGVEL